MTKLQTILRERNMLQRDLQRAIFNKHGVKLGDDRISKLCAGKIKNMQLRTAKIIADTLSVKIEDISEL